MKPPSQDGRAYGFSERDCRRISAAVAQAERRPRNLPGPARARPPAGGGGGVVSDVVPFSNATGADIAAGSKASPTHCTLTLLADGTDGALDGSATSTTTAGRHTLAVAIKNNATGWAVWRNGFLYPLTWDGC